MVNGVLVGRGVRVGALIRSSSGSGVEVGDGVLEGMIVEVRVGVGMLGVAARSGIMFISANCG